MESMRVMRRIFFVDVRLLLLGVCVSVQVHTIYASEHGRVIATNSDIVPGAVVEQVVIYPPASDTGTETISRQGFLVRYPDAQATIMISHGFKCDKFFAGSLRYMFPLGKYNIMTFDFRAHGESCEGQYCTFGKHEAYDLATAARFVKNHSGVKDKPLFVYGFSMGAVAAIEAQAHDGTLFSGMILDCPFESSKSVIKKGLSCLKLSLLGYEFDMPGKRLLERCAYHPYVQPLVRFAFRLMSNMDTEKIKTNFMHVDSLASMGSIKVPCLIIHCKNDEHISVDAVKSLYDAAQGKKQLRITNGRGHFDSFFYTPERYASWINEFLVHALAGSFPQEKIIIEDKEDFFAAPDADALTEKRAKL